METGMRDPRHPLAFALLLLPAMVVARFAAVAVHEILGHGLATVVLGGSFYAVYVSPGQGAAFSHLPPASPYAADVANAGNALAGIASELLLGLLLLYLYPRARAFVPRLFLLLLLAVLLVHTLLYAAVGALPFPSTAGDTAAAGSLLLQPGLAASFVLLGILWTFAAMYAISKRLLALLGPALAEHSADLYLGLFWILPLLVALAAGAGLGGALDAPVAYLALFLGFAALAYAAAARPAGRRAHRSAPPREAADWRGLAPLLLALALVLPVWIGAFGVTRAQAHGVILAEPPVAGESDWWSQLYVNIEVRFSEGPAGPDVAVTFHLRGVPERGSPLEEALWRTFDERADYTIYVQHAMVRASWMFNIAAWELAGPPSISGSAWSASGSVDRARVVPLRLADGWERDRVFSGGDGVFSVTLGDPYRTARYAPYGAVDELNLSWTPTLRLVGLTADPLGEIADRLDGPGFTRLRNHVPAAAPSVYRLQLRVP
jgi:hypothetical protein